MRSVQSSTGSLRPQNPRLCEVTDHRLPPSIARLFGGSHLPSPKSDARLETFGRPSDTRCINRAPKRGRVAFARAPPPCRVDVFSPPPPICASLLPSQASSPRTYRAPPGSFSLAPHCKQSLFLSLASFCAAAPDLLAQLVPAAACWKLRYMTSGRRQHPDVPTASDVSASTSCACESERLPSIALLTCRR